jgi:hypothetical protein
MLDFDTADRMAAGTMAVDDAPPGFQAVAVVIGRLGAPATVAERLGGHEVVASMRAVVSRVGGPPPIPRRAPRAKGSFARLAAVSTVGALVLFGALGSANALPGAAQDIATSILAPFGLDVGNPNQHAGTHPDTRGRSGDHVGGPSGSSRTDGLTNAAGHVTNGTASGALNSVTNGTPGPGLGSATADAASGGKDGAPSSLPSGSEDPGHAPTNGKP